MPSVRKLRRRLAERREKRKRQVERRNAFRKAAATLAGRVRKSNAAIKRLRNRIMAKSAPRIVALAVSCSGRWGRHPSVHYLTGHHSAGPKDVSLDHALALCRSYDRAHDELYGDGIGYHFCIARTGEIILLRPVRQVGAHVGENNTGNIGVMFCGTTGDRPTLAQMRSYEWLIANAHTKAMPRSHRIDLRNLGRLGHNDWPDHKSNECPGTHKKMILTGGRKR